MDGVDQDSKAGLSPMVSRAGNIQPFIFTVSGKTFGSLEKFFRLSIEHGHEAWGAPSPEGTGRDRARMLEMIAKKNGCVMNTGEVCSWHACTMNHVGCCRYIKVCREDQNVPLQITKGCHRATYIPMDTT